MEYIHQGRSGGTEALSHSRDFCYTGFALFEEVSTTMSKRFITRRDEAMKVLERTRDNISDDRPTAFIPREDASGPGKAHEHRKEQ